MTILNRITAYLRKRHQTRPTDAYTRGQHETQPTPIPTPQATLQLTKELRGTIILPIVAPDKAPMLPRHAWERKRTAFYAQLPPTVERRFPNNHTRQLWKIEQGNRRWLWRTNRELARELAKREGWV
jgi:hypothetical protein